MPDAPLLSELLPKPENLRFPLREFDVTTTCPTCGTEQRLDEATVTQSEQETMYICRACCGAILIISENVVSEQDPTKTAWPGRGWGLGKWMIRNPKEVLLRRPDTGRAVVVPAYPHALD